MAIIQTDENAGTPATTSGDIAQSGAAQPQTAAGSAPNATQGSNQSGSNFTNLQSYLDANRDNSQVQGGNFAKKIETEQSKLADSVRLNADNEVKKFAAAGTAQGAKPTLDLFNTAKNEGDTLSQQWKETDLSSPEKLAQYTGVQGEGNKRFDSMLLNSSGQTGAVKDRVQGSFDSLTSWLGGLDPNATYEESKNYAASPKTTGTYPTLTTNPSTFTPIEKPDRDFSPVEKKDADPFKPGAGRPYGAMY